MQAGKFLERADKITRILDVRHPIFPAKGAPRTISQRDALELSAILRSCSAWDAYKAAYGAEVKPEWVAEMLFFSDDFPRSVRFCVEKLDDGLRCISGVAPRRFSNEAEKLSGRLLAELEYGSIDEVLAFGLHEYVDQLQVKFNAIGTAERSVKVAVDFSPRVWEGTVFRRVATAESPGDGNWRRRYATGASWHVNRGLKSTAILGHRSAVRLILKENSNYERRVMRTSAGRSDHGGVCRVVVSSFVIRHSSFPPGALGN